MDLRVHLGRPADRADAGINATEKLLSKARAAFLVPRIGLIDVLLGLRGHDQFSGHVGCGLSAGLLPR